MSAYILPLNLLFNVSSGSSIVSEVRLLDLLKTAVIVDKEFTYLLAQVLYES